MLSGFKSIGLRATSIVVLLALWWAASALVNDPEVLPAPLAVAQTIAADFKTPGPKGNWPISTSASLWLASSSHSPRRWSQASGSAWRWD